MKKTRESQDHLPGHSGCLLRFARALSVTRAVVFLEVHDTGLDEVLHREDCCRSDFKAVKVQDVRGQKGFKA